MKSATKNNSYIYICECVQMNMYVSKLVFVKNYCYHKIEKIKKIQLLKTITITNIMKVEIFK